MSGNLLGYLMTIFEGYEYATVVQKITDNKNIFSINDLQRSSEYGLKNVDISDEQKQKIIKSFEKPISFDVKNKITVDESAFKCSMDYQFWSSENFSNYLKRIDVSEDEANEISQKYEAKEFLNKDFSLNETKVENNDENENNEMMRNENDEQSEDSQTNENENDNYQNIQNKMKKDVAVSLLTYAARSINRQKRENINNERRNVVAEFYYTEMKYCFQLKDCIKSVIQPAREKKILSETEIKELFGCMEKLHSVSLFLIEKLMDVSCDNFTNIPIGEVLCKSQVLLSQFSEYINDRSKSEKMLKYLEEERKDFVEWYKKKN